MCVCLVGEHGSVLYGTCCREPQSSSCGGGEEIVSRSCAWGERRTGSRASEKRGWTRLWNRKQWQHAPACSQRAADQSSAPYDHLSATLSSFPHVYLTGFTTESVSAFLQSLQRRMERSSMTETSCWASNSYLHVCRNQRDFLPFLMLF